MSIQIRLDVMLAKRKMTAVELSEKIGLTTVTLSKIKNEKVKGIRFNTLEALCRILDCTPGDLLVLSDDDEEKSSTTGK